MKKRGRIIERADYRLQFFDVENKKTKAKSVYTMNHDFEKFIEEIIKFLIERGYLIK